MMWAKDFKVECVQRWLGDVALADYAAQKRTVATSQVILSSGTALWKGLAGRLSKFLSCLFGLTSGPLEAERQQPLNESLL